MKTFITVLNTPPEFETIDINSGRFIFFAENAIPTDRTVVSLLGNFPSNFAEILNNRSSDYGLDGAEFEGNVITLASQEPPVINYRGESLQFST